MYKSKGITNIKSLYFYEKHSTYLSGFRKRGAEKRARPTGASGQPIRKENLSDFFLKKQPTYLSGFRKRRAENVPDLLGRLANQ